MKITAKLWIGLAILAILSPLGLILPEHFKAGPAWGEWGSSGFWHAPMSDYALKGLKTKGLAGSSLAYIISAIIGISIIAAIVIGIGKLLTRKDGPSVKR